MTIKVAINGIGRIGKCVLRALYSGANHKNFNLVSINSSSIPENLVHMIKYDSVHGVFDLQINHESDKIKILNQEISIQNKRKISELNFNDIDIVFECTGKFNSKTEAMAHIDDAGAKKVIVSAPCSQADATIIYGVNQNKLLSEHQIISIGSCTTNCLAPVVDLLNKSIGIESGFVTTIHSYTNDQRILDGSHQDLRRSRAANLSIIPTSTGAAKTIGLIIPELEGKLDGAALRVPTPNVSLIDFKFLASRDTSVIEINNIFNHHQSAIIGVATAPLVSIDFTHDSHSAIFDPFETKVVNQRFARIVAWYDNEWAFAQRMLDVAKFAHHLST